MSHLKRSSIITTLAVFIFTTLFSSYTVSALANTCDIPDPKDPEACLDTFYSNNNITLYNPNAKTCSSTSSTSSALIGDDNAAKIFNYLTGKGLSPEQAAGVVGNFKKEATLAGKIDPAVIQGDPPQIAPANYAPVNGVGFGIAQWTFTPRQAPLVALAKSQSKSIIELSVQLDYLWQELNSTHAVALASLKAATTPEDAAYVFHRDYEGSRDTEQTVRQVRGGAAREAFEKYKGASVTANASSSGCTSTGASLTNFMGDNFTIYNQCQYPPYGGSWGTKLTPYNGTMCANACVPTGLAMISKNLAGKNVTPNETIDYFTSHNLWSTSGTGSNNDSPLAAAEFFGLKIETIANKGDITAYKQVFDKGGLIMALSAGSSPFLSTRHAIVLRGITTEGNFLIADPGRRETNIPPANQPSTDKILSDIRADGYSVSYAFYKQ